MIGLPEMQLQGFFICLGFFYTKKICKPQKQNNKAVGFEGKRFTVEYVVFFKALVVFPVLSF